MTSLVIKKIIKRSMEINIKFLFLSMSKQHSLWSMDKDQQIIMH